MARNIYSILLLFCVLVLAQGVIASGHNDSLSLGSSDNLNLITGFGSTIDLNRVSFFDSEVSFSAKSSVKRFDTLNSMFSEVNVGLSCPNNYFNSKSGQEDFLECGGATLANKFENPDGNKIKQTITLTNNTSRKQTREVSITLISNASELQTDTGTFSPTIEGKVFETKKSSVQFTNSQDANFSPLDFNISVDSHVSFLEDGINIGTYDWRDLTETKYPTRTTTYKKDGKTYVKTVITAIIPANSTITLDPTYDLSLSTNYAVRWVGPYSGGTDFFYIGASNGSGQGVQLVNVDGGTYSNDLLITAYNAGNSHGNGVGNGAVYLIKNIDNLSGSKDMASGSSYNVVWNGAGSSAKLGSTSNSGLGVQLANVDNGAYANDLLLTAYYGTANSKSSNGTVFLIRNIDGLSGDKYLTNSTDYNVLWNGGTASDYLGSTNGSGLGVQLVNVDGNTYSNDLLITGYYVSVNSKTRNGAVYLIKDIDSLSGAKDLSSSSNYTVMWAGGGAAASDYLGYTTNSGSSGSGLGVQLVNVDGGIFSNDLLLTAVNADVNSKSNDGAVYLIRNIDGLSGGKYLNSSSDYNVMWNGGAASDYLGNTGGSGLGVQLVNVDGNAYSNDLLLTTYKADVNSKADSGAVYLIKNIDGLSGAKDLVNLNNFDVRWNGGAATDSLGYTIGSGLGVQLVNVDGSAYANDLLLAAVNADVNGLTDNGVVYLIKGIDGLSGVKDLSDLGNFDVCWNGSVASDKLGSTDYYGGNAGLGVQLVNVDGNAYSNDLLLTAIMADVNGLTDNGAVYLIKGIDGLSGAKDLSSLSNFDVRWNGGAASDSLGANYGSGLGVQLVNLDNGAYANDLLLTAFIADVNGKADSGAVYLIKGVDGLSGAKDLVNLNNFDVRWNGATSYDDLGGTTQSGLASLGVQLVNMDGGRYANDLLLTAAFADVGGYSNNGAVYLIRNINGLSGIKDLNSSGSYDALFRGGFDSEQLGNTGNSGAGVQVVNIDQGTYTNDLLLSSYTASIGSKLYAGVVYLIRDPVIKTADLNFVSFDWNSGSFGMPSFSFVRDGNVTIDFNVFDSDNYRLKVDINYSTTNTAGTGTSIVRDLNLTLTNCTSQDWNVSPVDCNYDWNISSLLVADGNYYILIKIDDNLTPLSKDLGLLQVDNTPPSTLGDGSNNIWQLLDGNIHLTCNDGAGSGCYLTQYRLDTDPTNGVYWGNWQNYSGSILIFGDGNFAIDFNSRDNAGNVGDVNEFFIIIGPHGRLTTYNANVLPRSFFVSSNTVDLRFDANLVLIPPIEIFDSAGTLRDSNYFSLTVSASDINSFDYNFVVSGASGWYDVRIGSQYFPKAFYKGTVWQSRFMDDSNNVFPFSYDLNVTEPNIINRWLSSFDTNVNFTYGANPSSIRVLDCNETGACIEIPSQIYDSVTNSGLVTSARLVFPASIGKNETRHFIVSYSSQSLPKSYFVDFNTLQNGYIFDFNNSIFKMTVDMNKGGNITRIVSNRASISDLNGSTLMFYSPSTFSGGITNNPASLVNPSFSIDANGPLVSIISVSGTVGGMSYTEKYKVYANTSFFLYDQNISSNQSGVLWVLSDSYSFFSARKFNKYANFTNNTLSVNDVNTLNNTLSGGDANFVGVYDKSTLDGVGEIFLSRQSSISHVPPTISFYDQAAYSYWQRQVYSGQVNNGDYFSSSSAVAVFNPWNGSSDLNNIFVQVTHPLTVLAGGEVVIDSNAPVLTAQGHSPSLVLDSADLNCYSTWHDDLLLDYVLVNVAGPDLNISGIRLNARVTDYNAVYTIPSSLLNAGDVNCVFTVYNVAAKTATTTESIMVTDTKSPQAVIVNSPDTNALIDPGTDIRVDANITEYIGIKDINLFTRVYNPNTSTWSDWSSSAMVNDANYGNYKFHYYADFNTTPEVDSLWQYKIYSSDTLDHNSDTNTVSVYSYWDWTWSATPSSFDTRVVLFGEQASLGDLSITNTGDELLNLMISSDWDNKDQITYNGLPETSIGYRFSIDTGSSILIRTKANAKTVQSDVNFGIYVNALDSLASPAKTTTLARVVSYAGGSYLLIDWVDSNTSVTKGDTGLLYTVRVTNKGNETATIPITLDWNIPSGWTLTSGVLSTILDSNLNVDSYISNSIGLTVSDSAVSGAQNIIFTAGCCGDVNKTQTSTLAVTVNDTSVIVVNPPEEQGGAAGAGPGGGAGIGGGGGSIFSTAQEAEFFKTSERFELIRGKDDEFIVRVKNPFSDRNLLGLTASVSGLLSKYLEIVNPSIGDLGPGQEKSFTVKVAAPKYFDIGKHDLVFTINGILASGKGKRETSFTYENKVVLAVHDLNISEAIDIVNNGAGKINELKALGVNVEPLEKLLVDANIRLNGEDYEGAKTNIESILALSGIAIQVLKDLNSISEGMSKSASNGVDTPKTMRLFTIAKLAFERGEYDKANLVLKDALLTMSLETKGAFNAGYFIVQNSAQIGAGIIIALVFLSSLFLFIKRSLLKRRVGKLGYEENLLLSLMKELQKACFVDNKIGMDEYQTALKHYENRLGTAVDKIINTQNELSNLISLKSRTTKLNEERQRLINEMRNTQTQYFKEGLIESRVYNSKQTSLGKHLGEIEKDITYSSATKTIRLNSSSAKILWKIYYTIFK